MTRAVTCTLGLGLTLGVCCTNAPLVSERVELAKSPAPAINNAARPLSEIDLSQIGHIAPKGRVQDKDYNELAISDELIANGKDSIPFLISKLEDETVIDHHVIDYWPGQATVGDVAFVILTDFTTDSSWTKNTIRGADPDSILGKYDPNLPGVIEVAVNLKAVSCGTEINIEQANLPTVIPVESCYLGWQQSLAQLALLVEPDIPG